jgi:hypothetical protein
LSALLPLQAVAAGALQPGEEVRMRLVYDGRGRQPRIEYVGRPRAAGARSAAAAAAAAAAGIAGVAGPSKLEAAALEPPPQMDEEGLLTLIRLLRLSQPLGKGQLQRLFHNLCANTQTREVRSLCMLWLHRGCALVTCAAADVAIACMSRVLLPLPCLLHSIDLTALPPPIALDVADSAAPAAEHLARPAQC